MLCSLEAGEGQGEKAPLLLAYEQAYLPKPSKTPGQTPDKERQQPCARPAGAKQPPGSRCKVPEWRDVLLTAALIWLAATGLVLVIAMVKVGMYQVTSAVTPLSSGIYPSVLVPVCCQTCQTCCQTQISKGSKAWMRHWLNIKYLCDDDCLAGVRHTKLLHLCVLLSPHLCS